MEAYRIGVQLAMSGNAPQFFQALSSQILHVHTQVGHLQGAMDRLKLALAGGFMFASGTGLVGAMGKMVEHGNELVRVQRNMAQAGVEAVKVQDALAKSWEMTGKYKNMSAVEVIKAQNDARGIFGHQDVATHEIESIVKAASFLKSFQGREKGGATHSGLMREMNDALKSGEIAGKITPAEMEKHVENLVAMKVAFGDQMSVSKYLTAQRAAGVSMRNADDQFRYGIFPALIQENGPNAGVMLMTSFNKVVAGVQNRTNSLQAMQAAGLLNEDQIKYDKVGRAVGLKDPSAIMNNNQAATNFAAWVMGTLRPRLEAEIDKEGVTDPAARSIRESQKISQMFPDRNAAKAITEIIQQFPKLTKDAELVAEALKKLHGEGMAKYTAGSYDYQVEAFKTQWKNIVDALGAPLVGKATEALARVNETLSQWAQMAAGLNPETVASVGKAIAALGVGLAVLGGVAVTAALLSFAGPAGIIAGIAAGLAALAALNIGSLKEFGTEIAKTVQPIIDAFELIAGAIKAGVEKIKSVLPSWASSADEANTKAAQEKEAAPRAAGTGNSIQRALREQREREKSLQDAIDAVNPKIKENVDKHSALRPAIDGVKKSADALIGTMGGLKAAMDAAGGGASASGAARLAAAGSMSDAVNDPSVTAARRAAASAVGDAVAAATPSGENAKAVSGGFLDRSIRRLEGFNPRAYWDHKQWSIGYGTRARRPGEVIDRGEAERRLAAEMGKARGAVARYFPGLDAGTQDALTSLTYNAGTRWMQSGLGAAVRRGDLDEARRRIMQYTKASGRVNPGLVSRRREEAGWIGRGNAVPPPRRERPVHLRSELVVDGQRMAANTTRHQGGFAYGPGQGGRSPDPGTVYPQVG